MMTTRKKQGTVLTLFLLLCIIGFSGCTQETPFAGDDFTFTTLDGHKSNLSDYQGKVVLLDCMAVNCQPCMYQMFELKKIQENYSQDDVVIISIDVWVSSGETATLLHQYIAEFKNQVNIDLNWTFGLDDTQGTIQHKYASSGVPTLYIFDKKGNIYYTHTGYEDYPTLAPKLDEALQQP
jgi:thiol-disulfide isomerase/thioredoxin